MNDRYGDMGFKMNRRKLLSRGGSVSAGLALLPVQVSAKTDGDKPSQFVPSEAVGPGPFGPMTAATGNWIEYAFYWLHPVDEADCE